MYTSTKNTPIANLNGMMLAQLASSLSAIHLAFLYFYVIVKRYYSSYPRYVLYSMAIRACICMHIYDNPVSSFIVLTCTANPGGVSTIRSRPRLLTVV